MLHVSAFCSWSYTMSGVCVSRLMPVAGRHRDNYNLTYWKSVLNGEKASAGTPMGGHENSQRVGSEVLIYSEGNAAMEFALSFPPVTELAADIKNYVIKEPFTVRLGKGTLLIYKDIDDQFFCHEAFFSDACLADEHTAGCYRLAFVFRWLTSAKQFRADSGHAFKARRVSRPLSPV